MNFKKRTKSLSACILGFILLSGCAVSLASDITPPPNAESYTAQDTPAATQSIFPIVPPDPIAGREIFATKCAPCHGQLGLGDGPQSGNLPVSVAAIGDPKLAFDARPVDWYSIVTNGNLERYMPGFASLDDRQRWDVVAYALSLSLSGTEVNSGKAVYTANCTSCHGESGAGGLNAPDWQTDPGRLSQLSLNEIQSVTENGKGEMPGFSGSLTAAELKSVAQYIRQMSFAVSTEAVPGVSTTPEATPSSPGELPTSVPAGSAEPLPQPNLPDAQTTPGATPEAAAPSEVVVMGKVSAPAGSTLPSDLTVTLLGFDSMSQAYEANTRVATDGTFAFTGVEFVADRAFMATMDYNGVTYNSEVFHGADLKAGSPIELNISYFETTSDTSLLRVERLHIFFDFTRTEVVQVVELFILNNTGDKAIVPESGKGSVSFDLPAGAANLQFQDSTLGERYLQTEKGFSDTASILPGDATQILFAYDMPYNRKATINIPLPLDVDAAVVMVPAGSVKLTSDLLQSTGVRDVQGVSLEMFSASGLKSGTTLDINLAGKVSTSTTVETGSSTGLFIGGGVLGLVLVGTGVWMWRQRKRPGDGAETVETGEDTRETIMDAIIALDDAFQAGSISREAYQARRAELKEKLQQVTKS